MQYSIIALLGSASAVPTPGPLPINTYPSHATAATLITTAGATQEDDADFITAVYSKVGANTAGPYRAFRNKLFVFPTQKIAKATATAGNKGAVVDQTTASRTFWVVDSAMLGNYPVKSVDGSANVADGATWTICKNVAALQSALKCNGGPTWNTNDNKSYMIPNRIAFKANTSGSFQIGDATDNQSTPMIVWHQDLLMASLYHSANTAATPVTDGTKWCSIWKNTIKSDGSDEAVLSAHNGLTGRSKCTWLVLNDDGNAAPGIRLANADYTNFIFQWTEWISVAGLGTQGVLPATQGANYWLGNYAATEGVFMNPVTSGIPTAETLWTNSNTVWAYRQVNPANRLPGSIGDIIYYPGREGPFKETQTVVLDSGLFIQDIMDKRKENQDFEAKKGDYNQKKTKFDEKADKFEKREKDFIAKSFTPEEKLPERPERPERPAPYKGPNLNLLKALETTPVTWKATWTEQGSDAVLRNGATNAPSVDFATRTGFLQSTADQAATDKAAAIRGVGHVFGRLGQGVASYPGNAKAFYWGKVEAANRPGMLVSAFPNTDSDVGLDATTKNVTIVAKAVPWIDLADFVAPPQPDLPAEAKKDPRAAGASSIAAGLIASVAVLSSLY
jgi:hypothetical protein